MIENKAYTIFESDTCERISNFFLCFYLAFRSFQSELIEQCWLLIIRPYINMFVAALIIVGNMGCCLVEPAYKGFRFTKARQSLPHLKKCLLGKFTSNRVFPYHACKVAG